MSGAEGLKAHFKTCITQVARCWAVTRKDGTVYGFTDHDLPLQFDGVTFKADSGLTARAVMQTTGLSVDNSEALGALSDAAITEADIEAGRFDRAEVKAWLVNWSDTDNRMLQFRGTIGELRRASGGFQAELRGLAEVLNQAQGRVYQRPCSAVLGDKNCGFDLDSAGYVSERACETVENTQVFRFEGFTGFDERWFERGRLQVTDGAAQGLFGVIKHDRFDGQTRVIELWEPIRDIVSAGDMLRIEAGCDKRSATCRLKFNNFVNFRGFPDIPGEDWLVSVPTTRGRNTGGSLRR